MAEFDPDKYLAEGGSSPSQPSEVSQFDPDAYLKESEAPQFDPDAYLEETGVVESTLRGIAQGVTMGYADEITAGLESLVTDKTYEQAVKESRSNYKKAEKDNPKAYGAGEVGGTVASLLIPGGIGAKLATKGAAAASKVAAKAATKISKINNPMIKEAVKFGKKAGIEKITKEALRHGVGYQTGGASEIALAVVKAAAKSGKGKAAAAKAKHIASKYGVKAAGAAAGAASTIPAQIHGRLENEEE